MREITWFLIFSDGLISLSMISSRPMHVVTNGSIFFFSSGRVASILYSLECFPHLVSTIPHSPYSNSAHHWPLFRPPCWFLLISFFLFFNFYDFSVSFLKIYSTLFLVSFKIQALSSICVQKFYLYPRTLLCIPNLHFLLNSKSF